MEELFLVAPLRKPIKINGLYVFVEEVEELSLVNKANKNKTKKPIKYKNEKMKI